VVNVLLLVCLVVLTHEFALFVLFWGYALYMPIRQIIYRAALRRAIARGTASLEELSRSH
jgi:hypothetical protein